MAKEILVKTQLGIFVIIGTLFFILALYLIGDKQDLFGNTFGIKAVFNHVNGLQKGNNVRFSGINVGTVKAIEIINDTTIEVEMTIQEEIRKFIKKDAIASLGTDGLMGNKLINISPGNFDTELVQENDVIYSINELSADEMLRRLEQTNNNIEVITNSLVNIIKKVDRGEGALGMLLSDANLTVDVTHTLSNIKVLSDNLVNITRAVENSIGLDLRKGTIGTLFTDTVLATNFITAVEGIKQASFHTEKITQELESILINVREGQGAARVILEDTTLSNNLLQSLENLQQGTNAFNENMEALKHNFLFRRYFRKLEKENK